MCALGCRDGAPALARGHSQGHRSAGPHRPAGTRPKSGGAHRWRLHQARRAGFTAGVVAALFAVAVIIFLLQSGGGAEVRWLGGRVLAPLWVVVFVAAGAAALLTAVPMATWRSGR